METGELHRGRLIDHLQLVVADLAASRRFYEALFDALDIPLGGGGEDYFWADELFVSTVDSPAAQGQLTGRHHLAFQAKDPAMVDAFHVAGLAAGGRDNGAPGPRPYHPGYYAAFLLDPDGNNVEAVHHGPATRSVESVKISFCRSTLLSCLSPAASPPPKATAAGPSAAARTGRCAAAFSPG